MCQVSAAGSRHPDRIRHASDMLGDDLGNQAWRGAKKEKKEQDCFLETSLMPVEGK